MLSCIVNLYRAVVLALFAAILLLLNFYSAISTSYIDSEPSEITYFVGDSVFVNVVVVAFVVVLLLALGRVGFVKKSLARIESDPAVFDICRKTMLALMLCFSLVWVLSTQFIPGADQERVQSIALAMHQGDYSAFAVGGYASMYPQQLGLIWLSYLPAAALGTKSYMFFQVLNTVGIVIVYRELAHIAALLGAGRLHQLFVLFLGLLFFPLQMYCSFVYGNVMGLALSLAAVRLELMFFEDRSAWRGLGCVACITTAMLFKSNYVIFFIAMLIVAGVEIVRVKAIRACLLIAFMLVGYCVYATAPTELAEKASGFELNQGASSWSWIAMGLQDGPRAPGWYNGYNVSTYTESRCDPEAQAEVAKSSVRASLSYFSEHKGEALAFFTEKTASQWNNPTFQGFWNVQVRDSATNLSPIVGKLISARGEDACVPFLNAFQAVVLFGALVGCVALRSRSKDDHLVLVLPLVFIGGFVCHLFWEAKCQYTITYFVLLFPCAVSGYSLLLMRLTAAIDMLRSGELRSCLDADAAFAFVKWQAPALMLVAACCIALCVLYSGDRADCLASDTEAYQMYFQSTDAG